MEGLPHLDARGSARMVDVGAKPVTHRVAVAEAFVRMKPETLARLASASLKKGDALAVARIAGIQGAKRAADWVPLAHPLLLTHVAVEVEPKPELSGVRIETRVETDNKTGVEIEALAGAMAAALSIYDMAKSYERGMVIERAQLLLKAGGQSGTYHRRDQSKETEKIGGRKRRA